MQDVLFKVYEHSLVIQDNQLITRKFIVLKNNDKHIICWTDFHQYIITNKYRTVVNVANDGNMRFYNVCAFLNYLFFYRKSITKLSDITLADIKDFLNDYAMGLDNDDGVVRTESTIKMCIQNIIDFAEQLIVKNVGVSYKASDLYQKRKVYNHKTKRMELRKFPTFQITFINKHKQIFRDIPEKAFLIIINEVINNHKDILMLVALSAFAGLRPSESCNVRREDSKLGSGIIFSHNNGDITNIIIDISKEYNLRSDLMPVGKIKKERMQKVYPPFIQAFYECYLIYMKYIEGRKYEEDYGALNINKQGKAITYKSYYIKFRNMIKSVIPLLLDSNDPETIYYGHLLQENNISPHIFRHWFSVKLVLYGEDVSGLMFWRGDKSPESALTYLQNKGDLEKQYRKANDHIFDYQLWKAGKLND